MLLLSRRRGERIVIGDEITVEIVAIDGATEIGRASCRERVYRFV